MAQRYCKVCSGWHDLDEPWPQACMGHYSRRESNGGIQIVKDVEPYRSVITREVIGGRRQHRDHLKDHGCIEIGNEKQPPYKPPEMPRVAADIKRAMEQMRG